MPKTDYNRADLLFVFGSGYPELITHLSSILKDKCFKTIIISGGFKSNSERKIKLEDDTISESKYILNRLLEHNLYLPKIILEENSTNSLENVLFSMKLIDFTQLNSISIVCNNLGSGRQYRTISKHILESIEIYFDCFTSIALYGYEITRENWFLQKPSRVFVFGEYLRNIYYSQLGHIKDDVEMIEDFADIYSKYGISTTGIGE